MKLISYISASVLFVFMNSSSLFFHIDSTTTKPQFLQKDSLPPLPPLPKIKRGWVGSFRYKIKMKGSGNQPKPYSYFVNFDRMHTGYLELTR